MRGSSLPCAVHPGADLEPLLRTPTFLPAGEALSCFRAAGRSGEWGTWCGSSKQPGLEGRAGLFLLLPAPRATRRDFLKWPRRPALCPMRARSRRLQPGMPGSGRSTAAFVPSDLGGAEGGAACRCRHPTTQRPPLPLPPPAARRAGSAGPERLSRPRGPAASYPLGASSQLKGLLFTVVLAVFQLLQDPVQHHRPLFLRGLCGSPDGKRGKRNSRGGWRQEERWGSRGGGGQNREGRTGKGWEREGPRDEERMGERALEAEGGRGAGGGEGDRQTGRQTAGESPASPWGAASLWAPETPLVTPSPSPAPSGKDSVS